MTNDLYCSTDGCGDFENNVSKILVDISRLQNKDIDQDRRIDDIEAIGFNAAAQTALDGTVKKTGNESIAGIKTFTDNVEVGTALVPKQLSIKGNLLIDGNITQNGSAYETHAQQVYTTDDKIIMRDGATGGLISGATSGLTFKKYDGTNDGELSVDSSGTARVGDVGDLQPLATRNESDEMTDNLPIVWDADGLKLITRQLTRDDVGLSNVDNTSDINKPISTATQTALDGKQDSFSLYEHTITVMVDINATIKFSLTVLNQSPTAFDLYALYNYLGAGAVTYKQCSGVGWYGDSPLDLIGVRAGNPNELCFHGVNRADGNMDVDVSLDWMGVEVFITETVRRCL